jgi:hypothetical protein
MRCVAYSGNSAVKDAARDAVTVAVPTEINAWFTARGFNVIWTEDGLKAGTYGTAITNQFFGLATTGAEPQWPGLPADGGFMLAWLLFPEVSFQYLDSGALDLGVLRDSIFNATNDYDAGR